MPEQTWEFAVRVMGSGDSAEEHLNALGQNGWDLVAISFDLSGAVKTIVVKKPLK